MLERYQQVELLERIARVLRDCHEPWRYMPWMRGDAYHPVEEDGAGSQLIRPEGSTGEVLLCAHTDVHPDGIGYDDSIGVAMALEVVGAPDLRGGWPWVLLTTDGSGVRQAMVDFDLSSVKACLVLDRMGGFEFADRIMGERLCSEDFARSIVYFLRQVTGNMWDRVDGQFSDAYILSNLAPTINLGIGVHEKQGPSETFVPRETFAAYEGLLGLLERREEWLP